MRQLLKVLVVILIIGGIVFGIYSVVPEHTHNFMKSFVQPVFNSTAKEMIKEVQELKNGDLNDATYKEIVERNNGMTCWVYERNEGESVEHVIFYGKGASLNLKDYPDYNGLLTTSAQVKIDFQIDGNKVEIIPTIDGVKMYKDGLEYKDANETIRKDIMSQLLQGMKEN